MSALRPPLGGALRRLVSSGTAPRVTHGLSSRIGAVEESFLRPVHKVEITVPATISNLGPGFDCFSLALNLQNKLVVERSDSYSMDIRGEGRWTISKGEENLIAQMTAKALGLMEQDMIPLRFDCQNVVPPRRGLGSSSAAIVAGYAAGLAFGGKLINTPATKKLILSLAAAEESDKNRKRHARIAPAVYGGFQISFPGTGREKWVTQRVSIPDGVQLVCFIPDDEASTTKAREILPERAPYADTIFNISRASMLVNCFATAQFGPLRFAMEDRLHQQHRSKLFPHCDPIIEAALVAGAHGAFLSGAGPSVVAITGGVGIAEPGTDTMSQFLAEKVSKAVHAAADRHGVRGTVHIAGPSLTGLSTKGWDEAGIRMW